MRHRVERFPVWTKAEIQQFEARWAIGTKQRLVFALALYTGLRRSELANLAREDLHHDYLLVDRGGCLRKSWIPVVSPLKAILDASPLGKVKILMADGGDPMTSAELGIWFRKACAEAGVARTFSGLRRTFAALLREAGATEAQFCAVLGLRMKFSAHDFKFPLNHKMLAAMLEALWKKHADDLRRADRSAKDDDDCRPAEP